MTGRVAIGLAARLSPMLALALSAPAAAQPDARPALTRFAWENGQGPGSRSYLRNGREAGSAFHLMNGRGFGSLFHFWNATGPGSAHHYLNATEIGSRHYWANGTGPGSRHHWQNGRGCLSRAYWENGRLDQPPPPAPACSAGATTLLFILCFAGDIDIAPCAALREEVARHEGGSGGAQSRRLAAFRAELGR